MNFYSLNKKATDVSFKKAVISGIAPDRGLYFPKHITPLPNSFFKDIENISEHEIALRAIKQFVSEDIPESKLKAIISEVLDFEFPIVEIEENIGALELFHGPTMAFKDVGARFMAKCLGYFSQDQNPDQNRDQNHALTVVVATSGDTGGAVANGFLGVKGIKVVILYPSGKVSDIQERQLTTLGKNITALEIDGTFDDCQRMVKKAFLDNDLTKKMQLTSANSINIARWLPQMFYFLFAYKYTKLKGKEIVFSVPSGNFGNICAGIMAQRLGMPVSHFIAATNANDIVPDFIKTGIYKPKPSIATISNAMDVGDPSNFIRIQHLFQNNFAEIKKNISSYSFTDQQTKDAMFKVYNNYNYVVDPHGAVGYLGLKKYRESHPDVYGIFLETAHPVKFLNTVENVIQDKITIPDKIASLMYKQKKSILISSYDELKQFLFTS